MYGNITLTPPLSPPLQGRGIDVNKIAKSLFAIKQVDY